jgi:hypothetical protein
MKIEKKGIEKENKKEKETENEGQSNKIGKTGKNQQNRAGIL